MSTAPPAPAPAAFQANAASTRGARFREALNTRLAAYSLVIGVCAAVLAGSATHSPAVILAGGLGVIALVFAIAWLSANRRSERDFFTSLADGLGMAPSPAGNGLVPATPLLAAGDRRRWEDVLVGPLVRGESGGGHCVLAHYTYEQVDRGDVEGADVQVTEPHRFTVCSVDLSGAVSRFPGVYVHRRHGMVGRAVGEDWLAGERAHAVELESVAFTESYELRVSDDQDECAARELLRPSLVAWLAEHPLRPGFELRAGTLVVFVPGYLEDAGRYTWLRDATARIAAAVGSEVSEAADATSA